MKDGEAHLDQEEAVSSSECTTSDTSTCYTAVTSLSHVSSGTAATRKNNKRKRELRRQKRCTEKFSVKDIGEQHVQAALARKFLVSEDISTLRHTKTGWKGLASVKESLPPKDITIEELESRGFKGILWNGR